MEEQVEVTKETLGEAARSLLGVPGKDSSNEREKFALRQKMLWFNLDDYQRSVAENRESPVFAIAAKPGTGWTNRLLSDVATELETTFNMQDDQIAMWRIAVLDLAGVRDSHEVFTHGKVLHYGDHPDGLMRLEIQIKLADNPTSVELGSVPDLILTVAIGLHQLGSSSNELSPYVAHIDIGRLEWEGMQISYSPRRPTLEEVVAPLAESIFTAMLTTPPTKPFVTRADAASSEKFNLFGVTAEMLHGKDGVPTVSLDVKVARLFERGVRLSDEDLAVLDKMRVVVKSKDDIKHFLDEVFRHGNLWLYNSLVDALKASEQGSVSDDSLVYRLTVKGNWQEYLGPIKAKIKLKTLFSKTGVVLSEVKGKMEV